MPLLILRMIYPFSRSIIFPSIFLKFESSEVSSIFCILFLQYRFHIEAALSSRQKAEVHDMGRCDS
jgi:hypothetical protein